MPKAKELRKVIRLLGRYGIEFTHSKRGKHSACLASDRADFSEVICPFPSKRMAKKQKSFPTCLTPGRRFEGINQEIQPT